MPLFTLLGGLLGGDVLGGLLGAGAATAADVAAPAAIDAAAIGADVAAPVAADTSLLGIGGGAAGTGLFSAAEGLVPGAAALGDVTAVGGAAPTLAGSLAAPADIFGTSTAGLAAGPAAASVAAPAGVAPAAASLDPTALAFADPTVAAGANPLASVPAATGAPDISGVLGTGAPGAGPTTGQLTVGTPGAAGGSFAAPAAAPAAGGGGGIQNLVQSLAPYANVASIPLAAGGLAYNIIQGQKQTAAEQQLASQAAQTGATGAQLESYLATGTLPPGLQTSVQQIVAANKAQITQGYAARGMSTDPAQNSALAQDLANADTQGITLAAQIETQLLQSGASLSGIQANLNTTLAQLQEQEQQQIGTSISNFAQALGGLGQPKTVKLVA